MIKLITDTGADLSIEVFAAHNITYLPIPVQLEGTIYQDQIELKPGEFYQKLAETTEMPSTSRITPLAYEEAYTKALKEYDEIICITFSSELSAIYESAYMTAQEVAPDKISVIDSRCASLGQGLVVLKAAELIKAGKSRQEIVEEIETMCKHQEHIFACGSLEMLKRGGRISGSQALLGTILKVIPILQFDDGKIIPFDKVRGSKKMIQFLLDVMGERGQNLGNQIIGISHANDLKTAEKLADAIRERFKVKDIVFTEIGAAIGSHAGPKTLALFFQN